MRLLWNPCLNSVLILVQETWWVGVSDMHGGDFIPNLKLIPISIPCQIGITGILYGAILNPARIRVRATAEQT